MILNIDNICFPKELIGKSVKIPFKINEDKNDYLIKKIISNNKIDVLILKKCSCGVSAVFVDEDEVAVCEYCVM